jgi:hypothetical protein
MTKESLDILSKAPVGTTVEVEGYKIQVAQSTGCGGCLFDKPPHCGPLVAPRCLSRSRPDGQSVSFFDVTEQKADSAPWKDWPDAKRDGMCEIPVVIARNLRALLDEVTPSQWHAAGLNANDTIEATVFLDNAVNGGKGE